MPEPSRTTADPATVPVPTPASPVKGTVAAGATVTSTTPAERAPTEATMTIRITGSVHHATGTLAKGRITLPWSEAERLLAVGPHVAVAIEED